MRTALNAYVTRKHRSIQGWLDNFSARLISVIALILDEAGIHGSVVEIGVHHGRLFILLHLASTGRKDLVIDVFENQGLNIDASGKGDKAIFLRNVQRCGGNPANVDILQKSSLAVRPAEIVDRVGRPVIFSIDGGHTAECTMNDLRLADATLADGGVAILDDFFNEAWPEVAVGTTLFLQDPAARLRPFAVSPGKMYLCRPEKQEFFHAAICEQFSRRYVEKTALMFDSPVLVIGTRESRRPLHKRMALDFLDSSFCRRFGLSRLLPERFKALRGT